MYGLFSKGFGKKATDLNKKNFYDAKKGDFQFTAKGKTSNGVEYETNNHNNNDVKITVPVDDKCKISVKTEGTEKSEVEAKVDLGSGMNLTLNAANPDMNAKEITKVTGGLDYQTSTFSVESKFTAFDGPSIAKAGGDFSKAGTHGLSAAIAMDLPGFDGFKVAVTPSMGLGNGAINLPFAVGYEASDFQVHFLGGCSLVDGAPTVTTAALKGYFKANSDVNVGFELEHAAFGAGKSKDAFASFSKLEKATATYKIGADYKLDGNTTLKGKLTYDGSGRSLDFGLTSGAVGFTMGLPAGGKAAYGFSYTLEA